VTNDRGQLQDVYDETGEGLPAGASWPRPGELPDSRAEIGSGGLFENVTVRQFEEITRRLAGRPEARLRRHWGAALNVARKRDAQPGSQAGP